MIYMDLLDAQQHTSVSNLSVMVSKIFLHVIFGGLCHRVFLSICQRKTILTDKNLCCVTDMAATSHYSGLN